MGQVVASAPVARNNIEGIPVKTAETSPVRTSSNTPAGTPRPSGRNEAASAEKLSPPGRTTRGRSLASAPPSTRSSTMSDADAEGTPRASRAIGLAASGADAPPLSPSSVPTQARRNTPKICKRKSSRGEQQRADQHSVLSVERKKKLRTTDREAFVASVEGDPTEATIEKHGELQRAAKIEQHEAASVKGYRKKTMKETYEELRWKNIKN